MGSYFGTVKYVAFLICWHMIRGKQCGKHETVYKRTGDALRLTVTDADRNIFPNVTLRHVCDGNEHAIFYVYFGKERNKDELYFPESSFQLRIYMDITSMRLEKLEFAITIRDLQDGDYGHFIVDGLDEQICWTLIMFMSVPVPRLSENHSVDEPQLILEGSQATFFANKSDLVSTSPVNVTTVWLIDCFPLNTNYQFNVTEENLQIFKTPKELNGKILTYRAIVDGDKIAYETNLTLKVEKCQLVMVPERTIYLLNVGEIIPPITCSARCFAFSVHWESGPDIYNSSILDLGEADFGKYKMFTCRLRVDGLNVTRNVFFLRIGAQDDVWTAITALSISVGMIGIVVVIIAIVVSLWLRGRNICSCLKNKELAAETPVQRLRSLTESQNYTSLQQRDRRATEEHYTCLDEPGREVEV